MKRHQLPAQRLELLLSEPEPLLIPEVLSHSPDGWVGDGPVPADQALGTSNIVGHRLLAEDVLAGREALLNHLWLGDDGQGDNDGLDVIARQEVIKGLAGLVRCVVVLVNGRLGDLGQASGGLLRPRVDSDECEVVGCLDGGKMLCLGVSSVHGSLPSLAWDLTNLPAQRYPLLEAQR